MKLTVRPLKGSRTLFNTAQLAISEQQRYACDVAATMAVLPAKNWALRPLHYQKSFLDV